MTRCTTGRDALLLVAAAAALLGSLSAATAADGGSPSVRYGRIAENSPPGTLVDGVALSLVGGGCRGAHLLTLDTSLTGNYASDFKLVFHRGQRRLVLKSTKTLDREFIAMYQLKVTLPGCLRGLAAAVQVEVADQNDNTPEFTGGNKTVRVDELARVGSEVARFSARDCDADKNGQVTYFASPESRFVHVVPSTGQVKLIRSLVGVTTLTLHVYARDNGEEEVQRVSRPATLLLEVASGRGRDHGWMAAARRRPPRALPGDQEVVYTVTVSEDVKVGDLIFTVPDQKFDKRWFEVVSAAVAESPVQIERDSGRLYLAHSLKSPADVVVKIHNVRGKEFYCVCKSVGKTAN